MKKVLGFLGVGVDDGEVAGAAGAVGVGDGDAGRLFKGAHQLRYADGVARAEIDRLRAAMCHSIIERL